MTRVVIVGGGFTGLAAAGVLRRSRDVKVTLIDRRTTSDFLPMLPDAVGERANADLLAAPLDALARQLRFEFVRDAVTGVDLAGRRAVTAAGAIDYDYLLIAAGSETNFYGRTEIASAASRLDSVDDARALLRLVLSGAYETFVVAGGGYTGVEVATNLRACARHHDLKRRVVLCEIGPSILSALPAGFQDYARRNLERMEIEVRTGTTVSAAEPDAVTLSTGERFDRARLVWAGGVYGVDFARALPVKMNKQGRLEVDAFLRIDERAFAAGDAASFAHAGAPLRMSVQFAITEGRTAGRNILRSIARRPLVPFTPHDPGYVVPMANGRSCGRVLGVSMRGRIPTWLHYLMCIARSRGIARRLRMLYELRRVL